MGLYSNNDNDHGNNTTHNIVNPSKEGVGFIQYEQVLLDNGSWNPLKPGVRSSSINKKHMMLSSPGKPKRSNSYTVLVNNNNSDDDNDDMYIYTRKARRK